MTTLYFEESVEDDLRKTGFSKDGKYSNPQIFLGLLVDLVDILLVTIFLKEISMKDIRSYLLLKK